MKTISSLIFIAVTLVSAGAMRVFSPEKTIHAYDILQKTRLVTNTAVGFGGEPSEPAWALSVLLPSPAAKATLAKLSQSAESAPAIYGLMGLYFVDRQQYLRLKPQVLAQHRQVDVMVGCIQSRDDSRLFLQGFEETPAAYVFAASAMPKFSEIVAITPMTILEENAGGPATGVRFIDFKPDQPRTN